MLKILLPPVFQKEKIDFDYDLEGIGITQIQTSPDIKKYPKACLKN